jgi:hypothetical protein
MTEQLIPFKCPHCGHETKRLANVDGDMIVLAFIHCSNPECHKVFAAQGKIKTEIFIATTAILPLEDDLRRNGNSKPVPAEGV